MTKVKVCGITEAVYALAAKEAGADFIGLVFAPSRRQLTVDKALEIIHAIRRNSELSPRQSLTPLIVGVFVDTDAEQVNSIADALGLDYIQLSGDESWEYCHKINKPFIKAVRVTGTERGSDILKRLNIGNKVLSPKRFLCLLDSHVEGKYGGTGQVFDWELARLISKGFPVILAGGLSPESVAEAIRIVRPWAVDVSSGVETNGVKDAAKIKQFIEAVKGASSPTS